MQFKSYLIEKNFESLNKNIVLFHGENLGLKNDFKTLIKTKNKKSEIVKLNQEEIAKDTNAIFNELNNLSLFNSSKIYLIDLSNDKILEIIKEIVEKFNNQKIYIFANALDKKSKIRNFFEKSNECGIIACYQDNEITIKNIILKELKGYSGVTTADISLILDNCNLDRVKLYNELNKIKIFFRENKINRNELEILLNTKITDDFNNLRDEAFKGDKLKTNKLLNETNIDSDKSNYYLNSINQRLIKIYKVKNTDKSMDLEEIIATIKPPIFWKDRPIFVAQSKKWDKKKLRLLIDKSSKIELRLKSSHGVNKSTLIKNFMVEICNLANT
tara:strand:+ start:8634 stop:9623 length:990 start_codon:yes stop_codon:yes gene_type:complete